MTVYLFVIYLAVEGPNVRSWEFDSLRACEIAAEFITSNSGQETAAVCIEGEGKEI